MTLIGYTPMRIRTASELGALIRDRRSKMGLDQNSLAQKAGTSRKWIVEIEKGKPGAAIGLVLRTLQALAISLEVNETVKTSAYDGTMFPPSVDINRHLETFKNKR